MDDMPINQEELWKSLTSPTELNSKFSANYRQSVTESEQNEILNNFKLLVGS